MAIQLNLQLRGSALKYEHDKQPSLPVFTNPRRLTTLRVNAVSGKAQQLIQSGKVRPISPKDAAAVIESEGYVLLDVRPEWEREKARVAGSVHVPLFVKDMDNSPLTLLKKWVHFGYIGLWTGQNFTMINPDFVKQVEREFPDKDAKIILACGEGLRSMMAASKVHGAGYKNLGWLAGGFNRAADNDFSAVEGTEKLQFAAIGAQTALVPLTLPITPSPELRWNKRWIFSKMYIIRNYRRTVYPKIRDRCTRTVLDKL